MSETELKAQRSASVSALNVQHTNLYATPVDAMKQALEALESGDWYIGQLEPFVYGPDDAGTHEERAKVQAAIVALRERLAQPEQEPVACPYCHNSHTLGAVYFDQNCAECVKRMTTPPRREWVGLTLEEFDEIHDRSDTMHEAMVDVVKKLREKNA